MGKVGFKSGSVLVGHGLVLQCGNDDLGAGREVVGGRIICSVVAGVPEDTFTDHSRGFVG